MRLREVVETDLPFLFEQQRDPAAATMAHFAPRDLDAFMTHWRTNVLGSAVNSVRAIEVDGQVAGHIGSWQTPEGAREVGYFLGRAYWGRGVASAALAAFLSHHEARRPLLAVVAVHNLASRRVLEKCGFTAVGQPVTGPDGVAEVTLELGI